MKVSRVIVSFMLTGCIFPLHAQDTIVQKIYPHEVGIGATLLSYKYKGKKALPSDAYRCGILFSNLYALSNINYLLNSGYERYVYLSKDNRVVLLYGLDAVTIIYGTQGNFYFGGGPLLGLTYQFNNRFFVTLEGGLSYGALNVTDNWSDEWVFHRPLSLIASYNFKRK